ncbi:ser/Thr protein phosphatase superfamily [Ophiobolus disseminans]|uniref:Ser/Thr protein phosphatase superfamily n=1 Tax=Ophiobolus disseminans TaxID=1469910 RepID=A0A6A6ZUN1_9PLEO|nr:ser/Thr protein phosphatase superfamily [Ophiobolus disseminans]
MKKVTDMFSGPKTQIQILSDLHLDNESQYLTFHIPVAAPYLILAGNIGRLADYDDYLSFLVRRCNLHEKVYLVLGALEFHGIAWMEGLQLAHKMEQDPVTKGRLEVLYETRADVPNTNITLLGCTLWSRIPDTDTAAVIRKIAEFDEEKGIKDWNIKEHNSEHKRDYKWLLEELKKAQPAPKPAGGAPGATPNAALAAPRDIIVVTSFAPDLSDALDPWQVDAPWATAYGTNMLAKSNWSGVKMWISGTTGRSCEFEKSGVAVVSNQRGRKGEDVTGLLKDGMSERQKIGLFDVMKVIKI